MCKCQAKYMAKQAMAAPKAEQMQIDSSSAKKDVKTVKFDNLYDMLFDNKQ